MPAMQQHLAAGRRHLLSVTPYFVGTFGVQVAVDIVHHKTMHELHQKVAPSQVIVGWWVA